MGVGKSPTALVIYIQRPRSGPCESAVPHQRAIIIARVVQERPRPSAPRWFIWSLPPQHDTKAGRQAARSPSNIPPQALHRAMRVGGPSPGGHNHRPRRPGTPRHCWLVSMATSPGEYLSTRHRRAVGVGKPPLALLICPHRPHSGPL